MLLHLDLLSLSCKENYVIFVVFNCCILSVISFLHVFKDNCSFSDG
jgi:hypothetical protein